MSAARRLTAAALLLAAIASAAPATGQSYRMYGAEQYFTVEWSPGHYRGKPAIEGYVANTYGVPARDVRIMVESLDAGGQVVARTIGYVSGTVPPSSRVFFQVVLPAPAPSYRVFVLSWDWIRGPSGGSLEKGGVYAAR